MRCGTWMMALMLSIATLWSDRVLAADNLLVSAVQKSVKSPQQDSGVFSVKSEKSDARGKEKSAAASAVVGTTVLPVPEADGVFAVPDVRDDSVPRESGTSTLELKGVRG